MKPYDRGNAPGSDLAGDALPGVVAVFIAHLDPGTFTNLGITLVKSFQDLGVTAELVVVRATREQVASVPDIPVRVLGSSRTVFSVLPLVRYLRERRPAILLPMSTYPNLVALFAATCARTPETGVVVTEHNVMSREMTQEPRRALPRRIVRTLISRLYPRAAGLVAVSRDVLEDPALNDLYDVTRRPHAAIHNPIPSNKRAAVAETPHPWLAGTTTTPTLVAIGALVTAKGFDDLLNAVALLRNDNVPVRLVILGEGKLRGSLEQLVSTLGLEQAVSMPGFIRDPMPYLNAAAAFVLSSRWEGNPLAMLEAMSRGCPIVATTCVSGVTDIIEDRRNGMLVPVGDPPAMARAIEEVLGDRVLAERLGAEARASSTAFEPVSVARNYLAFFERCWSGAPDPASGADSGKLRP